MGRHRPAGEGASAGRGRKGGARDAFHTYAEQIFWGGIARDFFLKAAFFNFF
jgi:ribosomal protein L15